MKKTLTNILIFILFFGSIFFYQKVFVEPKIERLQTQLRTAKIKEDSLRKVKEGYYKKLVADTLTQIELNKIVDSLELLTENPKIVEVIKIVPKEVEKEVDKVVVKDSTLEIEDFYPNKENPFIRYNSKINLLTQKGKSKFTPYPFDIVLSIGQKEDGTFELDSKLPEIFNVTDIQVQATPMTPEKKDNFGILLGAGGGKNFHLQDPYIRVNTGIRYKKTYLQLGGNTNNTADLTLTFEF